MQPYTASSAAATASRHLKNRTSALFVMGLFASLLLFPACDSASVDSETPSNSLTSSSEFLGSQPGPDVEPTLETETAAQTCTQLLGPGYYGYKINSIPSNQTYLLSAEGGATAPQLSVEIQNATNTSFDFLNASLGINAVYVKSGAGGSNLYNYGSSPVYEDDGLSTPSGQAISHVLFCVKPQVSVSKTALTYKDRDWTWDIDKVGDETELNLQFGQSYLVSYDVTVSAEYDDTFTRIAGVITVYNPWSEAAQISGIADEVALGYPASVEDCEVGGASFSIPGALASGATLTCSYSYDYEAGTLEDESGTNTATVSTTGTVQGGTATADWDFADASIENETDTCIEVIDDQGTPGDTSDDVTLDAEFCVGDLDSGEYTFPSYTINVGALATECDRNEVTNTASFETNDNEETGSDDHTVVVNVDCEVGCTLTQGYWKTHSEYGPAPEDERWFTDATPQGADTPFFTSSKTWYQMFWTPPAGGNVYIQLAHQYMAAKLNVENGAYASPEIVEAIEDAEDFFSNVSGPSSSLSAAQRNTARSLASLLDRYNNGLEGTIHCDER